VRTYGKYLPLTSMVMFGGVGMQPQIDRLRRGVDILVATPGRLLDHQGQGTLDLSHVEIFVLDEADRMLDMGFIHDIKKVLACAGQEAEPAALQRHLQRRDQGPGRPPAQEPGADRGGAPQRHRRHHGAEGAPGGPRAQEGVAGAPDQAGDWHQVLVFTRMKHGANRLAEYLNEQGITAMAIHGNKSQSARTKALADFKTGSTCRCWWPPTSRRAASTSTSCRTS
jgi:ATP-dependent RNA helicase RhlE